MAKQKRKISQKDAVSGDMDVVGAVTVGERGQVVVPASVRQAVGLKAGDKLVVFVRAGALCMVPAQALQGFISKVVKHLGGTKH